MVDPKRSPAQASMIKKIKDAFERFFKFRFNAMAKDSDWARTNWKSHTITHDVQEDSFNCGIFVLEVSKIANLNLLLSVFYIAFC